MYILYCTLLSFILPKIRGFLYITLPYYYYTKSPLESDARISSNLREIAKEDSFWGPVFFKNSNPTGIESVNADKQGEDKWAQSLRTGK